MVVGDLRRGARRSEELSVPKTVETIVENWEFSPQQGEQCSSPGDLVGQSAQVTAREGL